MNIASLASRLLTVLQAHEDTTRSAAASMLRDRIIQPQSYVSIIGETSTGKSTLINCLIGHALIPMAAGPSTAAVIEIILGEDAEEKYSAVYRDASHEVLHADKFKEYALMAPPSVQRLRVCAHTKAPEYKGLHIFDTPGYNSIAQEHQEILERFLPESDVIIFVNGYKSGFGQSDQDLYELVHEVADPDNSIPVVFVINRVPLSVYPESDSRIKEIISNASDSLKRELKPLIIRSATENAVYQGDTNAANNALPDASVLWQQVSQLVHTAERKTAVREKLKQALLELAENADKALERAEQIAIASNAELVQVESQVATLELARKNSLSEIAESMTRIASLLLKVLEREVTDIRKKLQNEILSSSKWLGAEDCAIWVAQHALPSAVKNIAKTLEFTIYVELQELNEKLEEIANTAIHQIESDVQVRSDASTDFAKSLGMELTERLAGAGINRLLRSIGGVGGDAAGMGNVVKMLSKRLGKLVGKTFSREFYEDLGRMFTKELMEKMAVVVAVLIEVGIFIYEAQTWQKKLYNKVSEAIDEWHKSVNESMLGAQLNKLRMQNEQGIQSIYDPLIRELLKNLELRRTDAAPWQAKLAIFRAELALIRAEIPTATFQE